MIGTEKNEREMKDLRKWVFKKSVERKFKIGEKEIV